jgi:hypothetical protein
VSTQVDTEPVQFVDAETGEPVDLEALEARAKPPEQWTLEESHAYGEQQLGWTTPNPESVRQLTLATRRFPALAQQLEEVKAFVKTKHPAAFAPKQAWAAPLDLRRRAIESAGRQHPRARHERRSVGASAGGGDPPEGESDEPPDRVVLRPPLSRRERAFLRLEIDRRRRRQLVDERDHLRVVPAGGWQS